MSNYLLFQPSAYSACPGKNLALLKIFQSFTGSIYMRTKAPVCFHDLCEAWRIPDLAFNAFASVGQVHIIFLKTGMKNTENT